MLVRINSACFTGDIFGDRSCDCNEQFETALQMISAHDGPGLMLYHFSHEGKAHGYLEKLKAFDGKMYPVKGDFRDFRTSVAILRELGVRRIRLLSNNPDKAKILTDYGFEIVGIVPVVSHDPELASFYDYKARTWRHHLPTLEKQVLQNERQKPRAPISSDQ